MFDQFYGPTIANHINGNAGEACPAMPKSKGRRKIRKLVACLVAHISFIFSRKGYFEQYSTNFLCTLKMPVPFWYF
jgi:hypothetical protein